MSVDIATLGIRVDSREVKQADRDLDNLTKSGRNAAKSTEGVTQSFSALRAGFAALGLGIAARQLSTIADTYKNVQGRLSLVTGGTAELAQVTDKLYAVANRTRNSFEATADLYANLARTTKVLGASQGMLLQVTESISQALIISGATASGSEAALRQLGQAFASGALRGDELNSIMENTPRIAQAIADGMEITIGQLRELGKEGKLTAEAIFKALLSQKEILEEQFAKMPVTIGQSFTVLSNALSRYVGEADSVSGASAGVAQTIGGLARNIDTVVKAVEVFAVAMGIKLVASFIASTTAAVAQQAALIGITTTAGIAGFAIGALIRQLALMSIVGGIALLIVGFANNLATANAEAASIAETTANLKTKLEFMAGSAKEAGTQTHGLGKDALGSIPKIDAFGGRVGAAAQQLYNMARAAKAARVEMLQTDLAKSQSAERGAMNRTQTGQEMMAARNRAALGRGDLLGIDPAVGYNRIRNVLSAGRTNREADSQFSEAARNSMVLQKLLDREMRSPVSTGDVPGDLNSSIPSGSPVKTRGGGAKSEAEKAAEKAAREAEQAAEAAERLYKQRIDASTDYAESLKYETAEIGKNSIETKLMGVARQAALAPTKDLSDAIMEAGQAWLKATEAQANVKFKQDYADQLDQMQYENSLVGKSAIEIEKANLQRAITIRIRDAERQGITLDIKNIEAETKAIMDNIDAKGKGNQALELARETANTMSEAATAVRDMTEGFGELFGTAGEGFSNLINTVFEYGAAQAEIAEQQEEIRSKYSDGIIKNADDIREFDSLSQESARNRIASYGNMLGAAKTFFKEGSTGYKLLEGAERAYRLFQFAMQVKAMIMDAMQTTSSVAKSGVRATASGVEAVAKAMASLPPPLNFIAAGAVIAFLVAMGVKMMGGGGKGGSSGSSSASSSASSAIKEAPYSGPRDEYGNPTSAYSVLKAGSTTVAGGQPGANDNAPAASSGGFRGGDLIINGGADKRTTEELQVQFQVWSEQTVEEARRASAADRAASASRQQIGGR